MQFRTIARRLGVVATATTLLGGIALGGNANAEYVGGGVVLALTPSGLHDVDAMLSYDATPFPGGAFVEFNCKAVAIIDPASTGLDACSVNGVDAIGQPNNVPGAVAAAAGITFIPDGTIPWACVGGHANFAEGILGPIYVEEPVKCEPLKLLRIATDMTAG